MLCGTPHIHGDEIWLYYNALRFRGPHELYRNIADNYFEDESALVLAKLRLDGFVSLDADSEGVLITQPFLSTGGQLLVNVDAGQGELRAEILDAEDYHPLPGYTLIDVQPLQGDHLRGQCQWQQQSVLPTDRAVRVRFHLRRTQLYAFWAES